MCFRVSYCIKCQKRPQSSPLAGKEKPQERHLGAWTRLAMVHTSVGWVDRASHSFEGAVPGLVGKLLLYTFWAGPDVRLCREMCTFFGLVCIAIDSTTLS